MPLAELHVRLLKGLLSDYLTLRAKRQVPPPMGVPLLLQQLPPPSSVTAASWPEVLRTVCWLLPDAYPEGPGSEGAREALLNCEHHQELSPAHKLALLRALMTAYLDLGEAGPDKGKRPVHEILKDHFDQHISFEKQRRDAEAEAKRDYNTQAGLVDQRKMRRIQEAEKTLSSEALAAKMAAEDQAAMASYGRGGNSKAAKQAAADLAAEIERCSVPTVPFVAPPIEAEIGEAVAAGMDPQEDEAEAAAEAAAIAKAKEEAQANGVPYVPPQYDPATAAKRAAREKRMRREAARAALLSAIESRDQKALTKAIRDANYAGHEYTQRWEGPVAYGGAQSRVPHAGGGGCVRREEGPSGKGGKEGQHGPLQFYCAHDRRADTCRADWSRLARAFLLVFCARSREAVRDGAADADHRALRQAGEQNRHRWQRRGPMDVGVL